MLPFECGKSVIWKESFINLDVLSFSKILISSHRCILILQDDRYNVLFSQYYLAFSSSLEKKLFLGARFLAFILFTC